MAFERVQFGSSYPMNSRRPVSQQCEMFKKVVNGANAKNKSYIFTCHEQCFFLSIYTCFNCIYQSIRFFGRSRVWSKATSFPNYFLYYLSKGQDIIYHSTVLLICDCFLGGSVVTILATMFNFISVSSAMRYFGVTTRI